MTQSKQRLSVVKAIFCNGLPRGRITPTVADTEGGSSFAISDGVLGVIALRISVRDAIAQQQHNEVRPFRSQVSHTTPIWDKPLSAFGAPLKETMRTQLRSTHDCLYNSYRGRSLWRNRDGSSSRGEASC